MYSPILFMNPMVFVPGFSVTEARMMIPGSPNAIACNGGRSGIPVTTIGCITTKMIWKKK
jgi:hypothetical protein